MSQVPRLIFSARAVERLRAVLDEEGGDVRLRVTVFGDTEEPRFGFSLDREVGPEDTVVEFGEIDVVLDPESAAALDGSEVEYFDDDEGERFVVRAQQPQGLW